MDTKLGRCTWLVRFFGVIDICIAGFTFRLIALELSGSVLGLLLMAMLPQATKYWIYSIVIVIFFAFEISNGIYLTLTTFKNIREDGAELIFCYKKWLTHSRCFPVLLVVAFFIVFFGESVHLIFNFIIPVLIYKIAERFVITLYIEHVNDARDHWLYNSNTVNCQFVPEMTDGPTVPFVSTTIFAQSLSPEMNVSHNTQIPVSDISESATNLPTGPAQDTLPEYEAPPTYEEASRFT